MNDLSYNKIICLSWVVVISWLALRLTGMFPFESGHRRLSAHTVGERRRRQENRLKCEEQQALCGCPSGSA